MVLLASLLLIRLPLLVYRCYHAVNLRPIFTTRPAFNSTNKDKLPIFKQSNLVYKFLCRCNSTYLGMTGQRLEVRVKQHISRSLLSGRLTSRHSQAMDSAIVEHLLTIKSCRASYEDDCFSVLHRARDKFLLKFLEAIYISPLSMQAVKQSYFEYFWGTARYWGDLSFFPPLIWQYKLYNIYSRFYLIFRCIKTWKAPDKKAFVSFTILLEFPYFLYQWCLC